MAAITQIPMNSLAPAEKCICLRESVPESNLPLPTEITLKIFSYLNHRELARCSEVSNRWKVYATDNSIWRSLCARVFSHYKAPAETVNYKAAYKKYHSHINSLINGVYSSQSLLGHIEQVTCMVIADGILYSACLNETVKAWELKTLRCVSSWEMSEEGAFQGESEVLDICVDGEMFYAFLAQQRIYIRDLTEVTEPTTISDDQWDGDFLTIKDGILYEAKGCTIEAWDIKTKKCIKKFVNDPQDEDIYPFNYAVAIDGYLYTSSNGGIIQAWNIETGACITTFKGHEMPCTFLFVASGILYSSSEDGTIKAWDIKTGACIRTFEGHSNTVNCLAFADGILYSGANDSTIKVWNVNTGQCITTLQKSDMEGISSLVIGEDGTLYFDEGTTIKAWNFNVTQETIFKEIASEFKSSDSTIVEGAMQRFDRMPIKAKKQIYTELRRLLDDETLFHETSLSKLRAEAIENYLATCQPSHS